MASVNSRGSVYAVTDGAVCSATKVTTERRYFNFREKISYNTVLSNNCI